MGILDESDERYRLRTRPEKIYVIVASIWSHGWACCLCFRSCMLTWVEEEFNSRYFSTPGESGRKCCEG